MATRVSTSPNQAVNKTRNAILRMKRCSPELRTVLRQRCQNRIQSDRLKILNTFRKIKIQGSFRAAFGNILKEEWKNLEGDEASELLAENLSPDLSPDDFDLEEELRLEEILEKELLLEHEDWLLQLYDELVEDLEDSSDVVCPLCFSGYLRQEDCSSLKRTTCSKCSSNFVVSKSLLDLQAAIYESLAWHDNHCGFSSAFVNVPKNEKENNLCIVCHQCLYLYVIE